MPKHATSASFQPGHKGGPGRPRRDVAVATAHEITKLARSFGEKALRRLVAIMEEDDVPAMVRVKAADAVLNRGIGLPYQPVDVTVQRVLAKKLCECTIDELRQLETHLAEHAIDVTPLSETETVSADDH
jgi:hypothetical protein